MLMAKVLQYLSLSYLVLESPLFSEAIYFIIEKGCTLHNLKLKLVGCTRTIDAVQRLEIFQICRKNIFNRRALFDKECRFY